MPRAFSETEKEQLRLRLIAVGRKLINTIGIRALTIDDVARGARISKGSFYAFFPSREDFIMSVFESWEAEHRTALLEDMANGPGSPRERLERFFSRAIRILEKEPGLARLGAGEIEYIAQRLPPERLAAHQAADKRVMDEAFGRWIALGLIRAADLPALQGLVPALFIVAIHREDFPSGSYDPAVEFISVALAEKFAAGAANATGAAGAAEAERG